jgi:hypothetical protein
VAGPAQRLQAADMGAHIRLGVLALAFKVVTDALQMSARPVDAIVFGRIGGDVAVSRSWTPETTGAASTIMSRPTSSILPESLNSM